MANIPEKAPIPDSGYQYFSPLYLTRMILEPLRYFFKHFGPGEFKYTGEKDSKLSIESMNQQHQQIPQVKARILVDRGDYQIIKTGLTDNLSERTSLIDTNGIRRSKHMLLIQGQADIIIEASNEGTAELLADMVQHFLIWTRPAICSHLGMKEFGLPMSVSRVSQGEEDREKYQIRISLPYIKEEEFRVNENALKIHDIVLSVKQALSS